MSQNESVELFGRNPYFMSVMNSWPNRKGPTHHADSRIGREAGRDRVRRIGCLSTHTRQMSTIAATATKMSTMPCDTAASDSTTAAQTRYLPVRRPLASNPSPSIGERERDRERVLARHRRLHVAAVDLEALVEQEAQPGEGEELGDGSAERSEPAEGPAGEGEEQHPRRGDQLEGHPVRQERQRVECDDRECGHHHVEPVDGQACVPVHAPAVELEVGEQVVAEEGRGPHVGAHVTARGRGVVEQQVPRGRERVEVDDRHHDDDGHHQHRRREQHLGDPFVGPRPVPPGDRASEDAVDEPPPARRLRRRLRRGRLVDLVDLGSLGGDRAHSTTASPAALNPTWAAMGIPSRPVRSAHRPSTSPKANRPGYSTGRKWISANTTATPTSTTTGW